MAQNKIVNIHTAQPVPGDEIPKVTIQMLWPLPDFRQDNWMEECRMVYDKEAGELADVLCHYLPGGTIDALLVKLLDAKRCLLVVPLYVKPKTEDDTNESEESNGKE